MKDALNTRAFKTVPTKFRIQLLDTVLSQNIFEFNNDLFIQQIGTAIGTKCAPTVEISGGDVNIIMKC